MLNATALSGEKSFYDWRHCIEARFSSKRSHHYKCSCNVTSIPKLISCTKLKKMASSKLPHNKAEEIEETRTSKGRKATAD
ncbi:hypothetical protein DOY81_015449 [Sarcophaga bullata]|nr:hypothetical protein DOY81_015449 [Sarcophaga bullata]